MDKIMKQFETLARKSWNTSFLFTKHKGGWVTNYIVNG